MGSSGACNSPSTAFGGGNGHAVSVKCREKCKRIRRKVAGGGLRPSERWEGETDRECPGEGAATARVRRATPGRERREAALLRRSRECLEKELKRGARGKIRP